VWSAMFLSEFDLTQFKLPPQFDPARWMIRPGRSDLTLRFHAVYPCGPDSAETLDVIGYLVDREGPPEGTDNYHLLFQDIREGSLLYCFGYSEERGEWDAARDVFPTRWAHGADLAELRAELREFYGPDVEIPALLEEPVPEPEEMHLMTGYDA